MKTRKPARRLRFPSFNTIQSSLTVLDLETRKPAPHQGLTSDHGVKRTAYPRDTHGARMTVRLYVRRDRQIVPDGGPLTGHPRAPGCPSGPLEASNVRT